MASVLIIDDDKTICRMLSLVVERMGHSASYALTLGDGVKQLQAGSFDVVFLDVNLPDGNGLDALPRTRKASSSPEVIIITGLGDPDGAELAIKNGAWDYVQKPFSKKKVTLQVPRALEYREEKRMTKPPVVLIGGGIIGNSSRIKACIDLVAQAAGSDVSILITGETGTGKELFARAIHDNSLRADKSFVVVDCAALPETLVESVLFGHERGAFTGADRAKEGLVKQADGGTLFLDEVGELPLSIQKAFLRVLQEHRFRPVGGRQEVGSDFRLVAATNRGLDHMVQSGKFRSDLLFRLRSIPIELPPLREHPEDIKELALHYMAKLCEGFCEGTKGFSPEFFDALMAYHWPGNVRELVSTLERAIVSAGEEPTLFPVHLPIHMRVELTRASVDEKEAKADKAQKRSSGKFPEFRSFREQGIANVEKQYLRDLMSFTQGDIQQACRISDLSRSRLYGLLKKHRISKAEFPSA